MSQFDATTTCPANLNLPEVLPLLQIHVATIGKILPTISVSKPCVACANVTLEAIAKGHSAAPIEDTHAVEL